MDADRLIALWEEHLKYEFATRDTEATLATMVDDAYVNHIPVLTGGVGKDELREFYAKHFISRMPPDTTIKPISRTVGEDRVVDEMIFSFTHTIMMDWMLPGIARPASGSKFPWLRSSSFVRANSPTSISIGIRLPCWCRSVCSILRRCRSPESNPRARRSIPSCPPMNSWRVAALESAALRAARRLPLGRKPSKQQASRRCRRRGGIRTTQGALI